MARFDPRKEISDALKIRNKTLGLTAPIFKIEPSLFADNHQLRNLDTTDSQVIFGRRGTGKTTLLATFSRYISDNDSLNCASIELNTPDFVGKVIRDDGTKIDDFELAQIYFSAFITKLSEHLYKVISEENKLSKFFKKFDNSPKKHAIQNLIENIHLSARERVSAVIGGEMFIENKEDIRSKSYSDASGKFEFNTNFLSTLKFGVTAGAGKGI